MDDGKRKRQSLCLAFPIVPRAFFPLSTKTSWENRLHILSNPFTVIPGLPVTQKKQEPIAPERRQFMLVLKRVYRARVQTEMVEFIAWPFASSSKLKICSFHVIVVLGRQRKCTKKRDARAELLFCQTKRIDFLTWPLPSPSQPRSQVRLGTRFSS